MNLKITREKFEEVVSIEDAMNILELTNKEAYEYMLHFAITEDGEYLSAEEARKLFKKIPRKEFPKYITQFLKGISDAYVNPTNGAE